MSITSPDDNDDRYVLKQIQESFRRLERASQEIDTKAGIFLGFVGAIIAFSVGLGIPAGGHPMSLVPAAMWCSLLLCSVGLLIAALIPKTTQDPGNPRILFDEYTAKTFRFVYDGLARDYAKAWEENHAIHQRKAHRLRWGIALAAAALVVLTADAMLIRPLVARQAGEEVIQVPDETTQQQPQTPNQPSTQPPSTIGPTTRGIPGQPETRTERPSAQ